MRVLPEQVSAIRATLATGDAALAAWDEWKAVTAGARLDAATWQLIPMLYANLRKQGVRDPALDELRPQYVKSWVSNLSLLKHLPTVQAQLAKAGIDAMALKGTAMIGRYYDDNGARVLGDLDLLVPERRFAEALAILKRAGWREAYGEIRVPDTRFNNAVQLKEPGGLSVDLHCHVLLESCAHGADSAFWARSMAETIHGATLRVLAPCDLLVLVLMHGTRGRSELPHLRWIVDAALIIKRGDVDWEQFASTAIEHGMPTVAHQALVRLCDWVNLTVPPQVLELLRAASSDRHALTIHRFGDLGHLGEPITRVRFHWAVLSRGVSPPGMAMRVLTIPTYLRYWCQVEHAWEIPVALGKKLRRMLAFRFGKYRYPAMPPNAQ